MLRNDKDKIIVFSFTAEKMLIQKSRIGPSKSCPFFDLKIQSHSFKKPNKQIKTSFSQDYIFSSIKL